MCDEGWGRTQFSFRSWPLHSFVHSPMIIYTTQIGLGIYIYISFSFLGEGTRVEGGTGKTWEEFMTYLIALCEIPI